MQWAFKEARHKNEARDEAEDEAENEMRENEYGRLQPHQMLKKN